VLLPTVVQVVTVANEATIGGQQTPGQPALQVPLPPQQTPPEQQSAVLAQQVVPLPHEENPVLQAKPQVPLAHVAWAFAGAGQACPHVPQFMGSELVSTQV